MTPWTVTVAPAPFPLVGAKGERCVSPLPVTEPCTAPIVMISVTVTANEHVPVCGVASLFDAVTCTV